MSHSLLDSASHVIAGLFLLYRIDHAAIDSGWNTISKESTREHQLHVCGSVMAAVANLEDTWREAKEPERTQLRQGYEFLVAKISSWRAEGILPSEQQCKIAFDDHGDTAAFGVEAYRLDGVDSPGRRVNWNYRFTRDVR